MTRSSAVVESARVTIGSLIAVDRNRKPKTTCKFLLVFRCNYVSILYRFWDIVRQRMACPWNLGSSRQWHRSIDHIRVHIRFIIATTTLPRIVSEIKRDIGGKLRWLHTAFYVTTDWTILRCFFDNQARSLLLDGLLSSSDGVNWFCKSPVFTHDSLGSTALDRQTHGKAISIAQRTT